MPGECRLHQAVLLAVFPGPGVTESDPSVLLNYAGPLECPKDESCKGNICVIARKYRHSSRAVRQNQPVPPGEYPAELWRQLLEIVHATTLQSYS